MFHAYTRKHLPPNFSTFTVMSCFFGNLCIVLYLVLFSSCNRCVFPACVIINPELIFFPPWCIWSLCFPSSVSDRLCPLSQLFQHYSLVYKIPGLINDQSRFFWPWLYLLCQIYLPVSLTVYQCSELIGNTVSSESCSCLQVDSFIYSLRPLHTRDVTDLLNPSYRGQCKYKSDARIIHQSFVLHIVLLCLHNTHLGSSWTIPHIFDVGLREPKHGVIIALPV